MSDYYSKKTELKFLLAIHGHFIHDVKEWLKRQPRNIKVFQSEEEWLKLHNIMDWGVQEDTKKEIMEFDWTIITVGYIKSIMGVQQSGPHGIHVIMSNYLYPGITPYLLFRCGSYGKTIHQGYKYHPYQTHTPMTTDDDDNDNDNDNQ